MTDKNKVLELVITFALVVAFICGSNMTNQRANIETINEYQVVLSFNMEKKEQKQNANNTNVSDEISPKACNEQTVEVPTVGDRSKTKQGLEREINSLVNYLINRDEDGNRIHPCLTEDQEAFYIERISELRKELTKIEAEERMEVIALAQKYLDGYDDNGQRTHPSLP